MIYDIFKAFLYHKMREIDPDRIIKVRFFRICDISQDRLRPCQFYFRARENILPAVHPG